MSKSFLVIQTAFIGDVILATAVLEKLHAFYPDANIDILVRKGNESLFDGHPYLREVLVWNKKEGKQKNLRRIIAQVRSRHYDHLINLHRFSSSGIITLVSGAKERVGFNKNPFSFTFSKRKEHKISKRIGQPFQHEVERCLSLVEHLTDKQIVSPALYPSANDVQVVDQMLSKLDLNAQPFITISPASVWFTKQTPEQVWIEWLKKSPLPCLLLGGPGDIALCERIVLSAGRHDHYVMAGKLTLLQSAALMKQARMNYTNDSAPMHLCSAMNAPVTAVYCSTIPEFGFGPLSQKSFIVQSSEILTCKPCGLHGHRACPQGHFKCGHISISDLEKSLQ